MATGSSYQSEIKSEGTTIEHRKEALSTERQRFAQNESLTCVGGGLVGIEYAFDLQAHFPSKRVEIISRSHALLASVPGAHEVLMQQAEARGIKVTLGKDIVFADEEGRLVTREGERVGELNTRAIWCTGYKPNTDYLADPRTHRAISECLDAAGFVRVRRTHQLPKEGLEHIFAGGDMTHAAAHTFGERTADMAGLHALVIVHNILKLAGHPMGPGGSTDGPFKMASLNRNPNIDGVAIPLGLDTGLLWAVEPAWENFFGGKEQLLAQRGPLKDAPDGWLELNPSVQFLRFDMFPKIVNQLLMQDDQSLVDTFWRSHIVDSSEAPPSLRRAPSVEPAGGFSCFLSHDWGSDELGRQNHVRVKEVASALAASGLHPWLDEAHLEGDVNQKMTEGIEHSACVVVFVTSKYIEKANGHGPNGLDDNCKFEFDYSLRRKGVAKCVTVVMEPRCRDTSSWTGVFGGKLGGKLYVDLADDGLDSHMPRLIEEVKKHIAPPTTSS